MVKGVLVFTFLFYGVCFGGFFFQDFDLYVSSFMKCYQCMSVC